jgi:hypothetical protein
VCRHAWLQAVCIMVVLRRAFESVTSLCHCIAVAEGTNLERLF